MSDKVGPLREYIETYVPGEVKEKGKSPKDAVNSRPNSALRLQPLLLPTLEEVKESGSYTNGVATTINE
eukprot:5094978-Pyramimonas_sp.AAC.1